MLGRSQLATELMLGADEFDYYHVPTAPLVLGFFLREFNARYLLGLHNDDLTDGLFRPRSVLRTL